MPAAQTRMSNRPCRSTTAAIASLTESESVTSTVWVLTESSDARSLGIGAMSSSAGVAPSFAKDLAMAAPIPLDAPVTTATWPSSLLNSRTSSARPTDGEAAVDDQALPGDVRGIVGREEPDRARCLVHGAHTAGRNDLSRLSQPFRSERVHAVERLRALDEARDHRIDPDAPWCQFDGERAAEPEDAGLGRRVVAVVLPAVDAAGDGRGRHHGAGAVHPRCAGPEHPHHAAQV